MEDHQNEGDVEVTEIFEDENGKKTNKFTKAWFYFPLFFEMIVISRTLELYQKIDLINILFNAKKLIT